MTRKILIVDDDVVMRRSLKGTLSRSGFEVEVAKDGAEALRSLESDHFDAVVTDWLMPKMDGLALVQKIRAELAVQPAIVVLSSLGSNSGSSQATKAGADVVLGKPARPRELLTSLKRLIAERNG